MPTNLLCRCFVLLCSLMVLGGAVQADEPNGTPAEVATQDNEVAESLTPESPKSEAEQADTDESDAEATARGFDPPAGLKRLAKDYDVWIDLKRKPVVVAGQVCLRRGQLEMFACPKGTKEHESVISVNTPAQIVHAALLAIGAKSGTPVQFDPEYMPATGDTIEILVLWKDKNGKREQVRAQQWVKHVATGKAMTYDWVFAGSGFWTDPATGKKHYHGDAGDFICVSNFPTATLDLPVKSSADATDLLYEAFTENIPPLQTPVRLVLMRKAVKTSDPEPKE